MYQKDESTAAGWHCDESGCHWIVIVSSQGTDWMMVLIGVMAIVLMVMTFAEQTPMWWTSAAT
jgi:hypothetical protein